MRKIVLGILLLIMIASLICIFAVGGSIGAYTWCGLVFAAAPVAIAALFLQMVILIIRIFSGKKVLWNFAFIMITLVYALPILVLMGMSPVTYPALEDEAKAVEVLMPVENGIYLGGNDFKAHAYWPSERYAYDVVKIPYDLGSSNLDDYGIFGEDVMCPASGTVIGIKSDEEDIVPNAEEFISSLGNYIFLELDDSKTYIIMAHFKKDSLMLSLGDHAEMGDIIGKVGNSGTTSEPHLHIQHQKENPLKIKFPVCAEGLPVKFLQSNLLNLSLQK